MLNEPAWHLFSFSQSVFLFVALPEEKRNQNSSLWKWILNKEEQFNHFDMELKE